MSHRDSLEALQERRRLAREQLARLDRSLGPALAYEAQLYRVALERTSQREPRSTSQRVAMFGFQLLFVGPIASMFGITVGRSLRADTASAVSCLVVGGLVVLVLVVPALFERLVRRTSPRWRVWERGLELSGQLGARD